MQETKKIDELLKSKDRKKISLDIDVNNDYDEVTKKLEEERVVGFDDFSAGEKKVINIKEDLDMFDYLKPEDEKKIDSKIKENKEEFSGLDVNASISNVEIEDALTFNKKKAVVSGKSPIIKYTDVKLKIDRDEIIKGVTLSIYPGEFVYFVGKSGAGKSSLAKMIYREIKNTEGTLIVDDQNVSTLKSRNLPHLRRKIGVVFQDFKLLNDRTIYENVKYSLDVTNYPKNKKHEQVLKTLKIVGIIDQKDKYPNELSGGQQQRVAIARAIVDDPKIIVADEPTGNLDPQNALAIMEILTRINETGTTIVWLLMMLGLSINIKIE